MKERKELTISKWWIIPASALAAAAYLYAQSLGFQPMLQFICAGCAFGLITWGRYIILVFQTARNAEKNKTGWPFDVP